MAFGISIGGCSCVCGPEEPQETRLFNIVSWDADGVLRFRADHMLEQGTVVTGSLAIPVVAIAEGGFVSLLPADYPAINGKLLRKWLVSSNVPQVEWSSQQGAFTNNLVQSTTYQYGQGLTNSVRTSPVLVAGDGAIWSCGGRYSKRWTSAGVQTCLVDNGAGLLFAVDSLGADAVIGRISNRPFAKIDDTAAFTDLAATIGDSTPHAIAYDSVSERFAAIITTPRSPNILLGVSYDSDLEFIFAPNAAFASLEEVNADHRASKEIAFFGDNVYVRSDRGHSPPLGYYLSSQNINTFVTTPGWPPYRTFTDANATGMVVDDSGDIYVYSNTAIRKHYRHDGSLMWSMAVDGSVGGLFTHTAGGDMLAIVGPTATAHSGVIRFTRDGTIVWRSVYSTAPYNSASGTAAPTNLVVDGSGNILVGGRRVRINDDATQEAV